MKIRNIIIIGAVLFLALVATGFFVKSHEPVSDVGGPLYANRSQSAAATSTLVYVTPGTATTTLTLNQNSVSSYSSALVNLQVTATSTGVAAGVLANLRFEGSMDLVDWYPITGLQAPTTTESTIYTTQTYVQHQVTFSTSTPQTGDWGGSGTETLIHQSFRVPETDYRHLRVIISDPVGGGNYGLWAELVGNKESN